MPSLESAEIARNLIIARIKSAFPAAMATLRTDRGDRKVETNPPQSYFISEASKAHKLPAVYVVTGTSNTRKEQGANYANEAIDATITVLVNARDARS